MLDDIEIDDPTPSTSALSYKLENNKNGKLFYLCAMFSTRHHILCRCNEDNNESSSSAVKGTEKEKLFEGATDVSEPRIRTVEEIRAKYRKAEVLQKAPAVSLLISATIIVSPSLTCCFLHRMPLQLPRMQETNSLRGRRSWR